MRAVTYQGAKDIQVKNVEEIPELKSGMMSLSASRQPPFADRTFIYIRGICHCGPAMLSGMNLWGSLRRQVLM